MSKEYESKTEHKENLIDIAGLFDDLIKGIIQMKWSSIFHIYDQFQYYIREFQFIY